MAGKACAVFSYDFFMTLLSHWLRQLGRMMMCNHAIVVKDIGKASRGDRSNTVSGEGEVVKTTGKSIPTVLVSVELDDLADGIFLQEIDKVVVDSSFVAADLVGESGDKDTIVAIMHVPGGDCSGVFGSQGFVPEVETFLGLVFSRSEQEMSWI
jgi:hypothetical protein